MIKLVYSPHYDGEIFLGDKPKEFGVKYVGTNGLLQELGLRLGIPVMIKSDVERTADYLTAMQDDIKGTVFEKSAEIDPVGVASKLMRWRDSLRMAGWNGESTSDSTKLSVMAAVDEKFNSKGPGDYWRMILDVIDSADLKGHICEIQIDCPWDEIPDIVRLALIKLESEGILINKTAEVDDTQELDILSTKLVEFQDVNEAYEWIARVKQFPENTVVVNRDNVRLNQTLYTWDMPAVQSSLSDSNPQLLQLFKLSMSVFARPYNIQNLISYLQLPLSPIPSELRHSLARMLLRKGGFGDCVAREDGNCRDEWYEIIEKYEFINDEGKATPQAKAKKMPFLEVIRKPYADGVPKQELYSYVSMLQDWIRGFNGSDTVAEVTAKQLQEVSSMLDSFETAIGSMPDTIRFEDMEKHILQIYTPMNYTLQQTEQGSFNVINDIRSMACPASTLVWLDCQADDVTKDPYDFLSLEERIFLLKKGIGIPDFITHMKTLRKERIRLLNSVTDRVVLVKSSYDGVTRLAEHSIVAEVTRLAEKQGVSVKADSEKVFQMKEVNHKTEKMDYFKPQEAYTLGEMEYKGREESYSSIEVLIQLPFNYVMQYIAKLPMPDDERLKDAETSKGLVAHLFFQHIIADGDGDFEKMRELTEKEFSDRLNKAIEATGLILLQPENTAVLNYFSIQLQESMLALIKIMEALHLKPVGCEIAFPEDKEKNPLELEDIGQFGARIDFLLIDENDNYVIFDFKWTDSDRYEKKLEENRSIQLELYRQTVVKTNPDKKVAGVGYYLMPQKCLVTSDLPEIKDSSLVKHIDKADGDLFGMIKKSYEYRMKEIRKGHIEEAEMVDVKDSKSGYYTEKEDKGLFPLDMEEKTEGRGDAKIVVCKRKKSEYIFIPNKKKSFGNKSDDVEIEAAETPTSHSILKGRLK